MKEFLTNFEKHLTVLGLQVTHKGTDKVALSEFLCFTEQFFIFLQNIIISMYHYKSRYMHVNVDISHTSGNEVKYFRIFQDRANWQDVQKRTTF
jgi:hypothetical protein